MEYHTLVDFNHKSKVQDWVVIGDFVMGGKSSGYFKINDEGFGIFEGNISLENNGGFSLVRHRFEKIKVGGHTKFIKSFW